MSPRHNPEQFFSLPAFADADDARYPAPARRFDDTRDDSDALAFFSIATAEDAGAGE